MTMSTTGANVPPTPKTGVHEPPASVTTRRDAMSTARMRHAAFSDTYSVPKPSLAMAKGVLRPAAVPMPSAVPLVLKPSPPANVVTALVARSTARTTLLSVSGA